MKEKRKPVNISIPPDLLVKFDKAVNYHQAKRSWVLQECMRAYIELAGKCRAVGKTRLPTLEFQGCDDISGKQPTAIIGPPLKNVGILFQPKRELKVAEPKATYGKKK